MANLGPDLDRAEEALTHQDFASAYKRLREVYPNVLRSLAAASNADDLTAARRALLRCQDGLARCEEVRGEIGPAAHAAHAALELATVLGEPEADLRRRATYLDTMIDRLQSA